MKQYCGIKASAGVALGPVFSLEQDNTSLGRVVKDPAKERELFEAAVVLAKEELRGLQDQASGEDKNIFLFQELLLDDKALLQEVYDYIAAGAGSAAAVERAASIFSNKLQNVDDEYIRLRSTDVLDACHRVVDILDGRPRDRLHLTKPCILVAEQVMPSDILSLGRGMILGIATGAGSVQSHAAIIARTMGIPAVVGLGRDFLASCKDCQLLLDADDGMVKLDPDEESCQQARLRVMQIQEENSRLQGLLDVPCLTRDGTRILLMANCSGPEDIASSIEAGAEGVGLLRSEFLVIDAGEFPTEQEQYYFYTSCLAAAAGRPVTLRTFDLGADKQASGMPRQEENPALGLRGLRFCLARRDLFQVQLCALLRAGALGNLRVMFPMVSDLEDWYQAMECVEQAKENLRERGLEFDDQMKFGCMIEVPGAALMAKELAAAGCSFFSIGTNDLVQYTLAVDRLDERMVGYYRTASPAVFKLIDMAVDAGTDYNIPVGVCGLAASEPAMAARLVKHGVRCLSMAAQSLLHVKRSLMELNLKEN